jgi:hypothetical protein
MNYVYTDINDYNESVLSFGLFLFFILSFLLYSNG